MTRQTLSLIQNTEKFISRLLTEKLTNDHRYHNLPHTMAVRRSALEIGQRLGLPEEDLEALELAALFHDAGFTEVYEGHEAVSHRIAREFLEANDYPPEKLQRVLGIIDATFPAAPPASELDRVIRDADLSNLGSKSYPETLAALRHEWKVFLGQEFDDRDWFRLNRDFIRNQRYFTSAAQEMYGANKQINEKYLKRMAKSAKGSEGKVRIQDSRSAQMMFKTALRNHLDLSNLADNKANIMLSVNALILTFAGPLAISYVRDNWLLIIPLVGVLITCLISMIFATMATRPIRMEGLTDPDKIRTGQSNLFFFGNFYAMSYQEYKEGIRKVVANDEYLEDSIQRDLFFLGKSLGRKYRQLRTCYLVFMLGMVISVIAGAVIYALIALQVAQ